MALLVIDTSSSRCAVALCPDVGTCIVFDEERVTGHAERLFLLIDDALTKAGLDYADIEKIAVSIGPGSFTGVRVGVAAAKGLGLAMGCPVIGLSNLEALARSTSRGSFRLVTVDAKRGEIYAELFQVDGVNPVALDQPCLLLADETARRDKLGNLLSFADQAVLIQEGVTLIGSGAPNIVDDLERLNVSYSIESTAPVADIEVFVSMARQGVATPDVRPFYLRAPDAKPQTTQSLIARVS